MSFSHSSQFRSFGNALIYCDSLNQLLVEELDHVEPKDQVLRCLTLKLLRPPDFQRNSFNHPGKSCNRSLRAEFGSCIAILFTGLRGALLRAESCDDDDIGVDTELELETSRERERPGTKFSVLHGVLLPLLMRCGFGPSIHSSRSLTCTVAFSFVSTFTFAVTTFVGVLDTRAVSNSAAFKSFLLSMRIDDPNSTTNSLSSEAPRRAKGKCCKDPEIVSVSSHHRNARAIALSHRRAEEGNGGFADE